jgi:hypothetical protein
MSRRPVPRRAVAYRLGLPQIEAVGSGGNEGDSKRISSKVFCWEHLLTGDVTIGVTLK